MKKTFRGGVHPPDFKKMSGDRPSVPMIPPQTVTIPLIQNSGEVCKALVSPGDYVKMGQKIGDADAFISAPVHSSVSGTVTEIKNCQSPVGREVLSVVIQNDFKDEPFCDFSFDQSFESLGRDEIIEKIRQAGIVGLGGAGFPAAAKFSFCLDNKILYVIINASECEPYLTNDYRLCLEYSDEIIMGLDVIKKIFDAKVYFAVEDIHPDLIEIWKEKFKLRPDFKVFPLETRYPQGSEKQLVYSVTGKAIKTGKLPSSVGAVVINAATVYAIYEAVCKNKPLYERLVTVSGDAVLEPANYLVRVGTSFEYIFENCGGFIENPAKIIMGGPMMGIAQYSTNVPVIKTTSGILALTQKSVIVEKNPVCIRCGKCVESCPMGLLPCNISLSSKKRDIDRLKKLNVMSCIECGSCSFICPGRMHLVQNIRDAKALIHESDKPYVKEKNL